MLWLRSALFLAAAPGTVCGLVPWLIFRYSRLDLGPWRWIGLLFVLPGVLGLLWCFADFVTKGRGTPNPKHPPTTLVIEGLYRYTRNPMYVAVVATIIGEGFLYQSPLVWAWAATVWLVFHLFATLYEEPKLAELFGEQFTAYRARVRRWL